MKRLFLVPALGVAALAFSTTAHAQLGGWPDSGRASRADERQPYYETRRGGYDNGYREGLRDGEQDGRRRQTRNYRDERTWQRADHGYNRGFGDLERYRQQFRAGYASGYEEAYSRFAGNYGYGSGRAVPRTDGYRGGYGYPSYPDQGRYPGQYGNSGRYGNGYGYQAAYANGVNDGIEKGREDARKRRSYDPHRHQWYRSGDHDYRRQYGPRAQYENVYRNGFREGYDRGYRQGNYYGW
jgi:flagellar biosynthesis/type III secretory pathway protein FliH